MMNFLKVSLLIYHSFRSTGQSSRMKGFDRCLQVLEQCSRRRWNGRAVRLTLMTSLLGRNKIKIHQSHLRTKEPFEGAIEPHLGKIVPLLGKIVPFLGIFEPRLGRFKPLLGIRKSLLGITKFVAVLNTRYLGKFLRARNSTSVEVQIIAIDQTSTKAMVFLYEQSYGSDSNPFENYAKADFTKSFRSSMTSIYAQHSLDLRLSARDRNR